MEYRLESGTDQRSAPLVLCLHGQGMNEDWFALLLQKLFSLPAHFLIPRAPIPVGEEKSGGSWYHYDGDPDRFLHELRRLDAELLEFLSDVERTHHLEPRARILFGFSQGGYAAGYIALHHPELFGGLIVSGARVKTETLKWDTGDTQSASLPDTTLGDGDSKSVGAGGRKVASSVGAKVVSAGGSKLAGGAVSSVGGPGSIKVLLCHGRRDRSVSPEAAERSHRELMQMGIEVTTETFGAGHVINREQIAAIASWLRMNFL